MTWTFLSFLRETVDWFCVCVQSEADSTGYEAVTVCVPAEMPPVLPVTGESFCQCPAQTELSSDAQISPYTLSCTCGEEEQGEIHLSVRRKHHNEIFFYHLKCVFMIVLRM